MRKLRFLKEKHLPQGDLVTALVTHKPLPLKASRTLTLDDPSAGISPSSSSVISGNLEGVRGEIRQWLGRDLGWRALSNTAGASLVPVHLAMASVLPGEGAICSQLFDSQLFHFLAV